MANGIAAAGIVAGMADVVVSVMTLQQAASRFGASFAPRGKPGAVYSAPPSPDEMFFVSWKLKQARSERLPAGRP